MNIIHNEKSSPNAIALAFGQQAIDHTISVWESFDGMARQLGMFLVVWQPHGSPYFVEMFKTYEEAEDFLISLGPVMDQNYNMVMECKFISHPD